MAKTLSTKKATGFNTCGDNPTGGRYGKDDGLPGGDYLATSTKNALNLINADNIKIKPNFY